MTTTLDQISQSPYYDDYAESKEFLKILFRPGYSVQARELTQLQSILQNQIGRLGAHIFQHGSPVLGGQTTLDLNVISLELVANTPIAASQFVGSVITDTSNTVRASVISSAPASNSYNQLLFVKYLTGATFANGATVQTENFLYAANLISANASSNASAVSIQDGVYFLNMVENPTISSNTANTNGYFVRVDSQLLMLDYFDNTPTYSVGLQINDAIIDETVDTSLLDPAQQASNYQAPGATRYQINLQLVAKTLPSSDTSQYFEILKVQNGVVISQQNYAIYSDILNTLAQRTYDTSGNFLVSPFSIGFTAPLDANTSNFNVTLSPGGAFVQGYEYKTISTTNLEIPRATTFANTTNYDMVMNYDNYIQCNTLFGSVNVATLPLLDLHCVPPALVNTANTQIYANTKIGTARIRALTLTTTPNTAQPNTFIYAAYLFDVNTASFVSNAVGTSANTIQFSNSFSAADNAYIGMAVRIPSTGDGQTIVSYNGANRLANVTPWVFGTPASNAAFTILPTFVNLKGLGTLSAGSFSNSMQVDPESINFITQYNPTFFIDPQFLSLVFQYPNQPVVPGVSNMSYQYRAISPGVSFTSNTATVTVPGGEEFPGYVSSGPIGDTLALQNWIVVVTSAGTSPFYVGEVIPFTSTFGRSITLNSSTQASLNCGVTGNNFTADIYFTSYVQTAAAKTKSLINANTTVVSTAGGTTVGAIANVYLTTGQVQFPTPLTGANLGTPGLAQSLFISDGYQLVAVIDSQSPTTPVANSDLTITSKNITSRYTFSTGQKDAYYGQAKLTLNTGQPAPTGQLLVLLNYYSHTGTGFFDVDSYPNVAAANTIVQTAAYGAIPFYYSPLSLHTVNLRDTIDFRPRVADATNVVAFTGTKIPLPQSNFISNFSYYLGRTDLIVLSSTGIFSDIQGVPGTSSPQPNYPSTSMLLYILTIPPYTFAPSAVSAQYIPHKRYTMADIGGLEQRIVNLEQYAALSQLENQATSTSITSSQGLVKPQNGILVDSFTGSSVADVTNPDFYAAIDTVDDQLRPPFTITSSLFTYSNSASTNYFTGRGVFMLPWTANTMIDQSYASQTLDINPYNVVVFVGSIVLQPSSDNWVDTNTAPSIVANLSGDNDAWLAIGNALTALSAGQSNPNNPFSVNWGSWQTIWSGTQSTYSQGTSYTTTGIFNPSIQGLALSGTYDGHGAYLDNYQTIGTTTSVTTNLQQATGTFSALGTDQITQQIGDNVINTSIIPYMRSINVAFSASGMRPVTNLYSFFNSTAVQNFTQRATRINLTANVSFLDTAGNTEVIYSGSNVNGWGANSAVVLMSKGNKLYVGGLIGQLSAGQTITGSVSGNTATISSVDYRGGYVGEPAGEFFKLVSSNTFITATTLNLSGGASSNDNYYIGNTVYVLNGTDVGLNGVITSYNGANRIATVSGGWSAPFVPFTYANNQNFVYSIGQLSSDENGDCVGVFIIPDSANTYTFPTGSAIFRLIDNSVNNTSQATTRADINYTASGLLQTTQAQYVTTTVPTIQSQSIQTTQMVQQSPVVTQQVVATGQLWVDPLAQIFMVDPNQYPNGCFISSVRIAFTQIDPKIPVTLQIRPVVNGFPSSSEIIPFAQCTLAPSQCYLSTEGYPDFNTSGQYTEFDFDAPVGLQPGGQYAIILMSNSDQYITYIAVAGQTNLATNAMISQIPYLGAFFQSQNASTWTPFQGQNLAFRIMQAVFNTQVTPTITFLNQANNPQTTIGANNVPVAVPQSNTPYDSFYVLNGDVVLPNTSITYGFKTTSNATGLVDTSFTACVPGENFYMPNRKNLNNILPGSFEFQSVLSSQDPNISPVCDITRLGLLCFTNQINNGQLSNNNLTLINGGFGYTNANTTVTAIGGGGSGAVLSLWTNASGTVQNVWVIGTGGSGYITTPNIVIASTDAGNSANANVVCAGETSTSGGNMIARYITRAVTLATGLNSGDLQVGFLAYKPAGTDIRVYYKVLATDDTNTLAQNPWNLMVQTSPANQISTGINDFYQYTYSPQNSLGQAVNNIVYSTFTSFQTFAIKIVMLSSNPTIIPQIVNFTCVAMPAST